MAKFVKAFPSPMPCATILRRLGAIIKAVVTQDMGDAEAIGGEDTASAGGLGDAVFFRFAPAADGLLIAPEGEREELAAGRQAFEALDGKEAVRGFQLSAQLAGEIEIAVALADEGDHFEDDGDHGWTFRDGGLETFFRKSRSSSKMKRAFFAKS